MNKIRENVFEKMTENKKIDITNEQKEEYKKVKRCLPCNGTFDPKDPAKTKVRDHCHFTGLYRGPAHNKCNLDFAFKYFKILYFFITLKTMTLI